MAFPDNYIENQGKCVTNHGAHTWTHSGHPLTHRCILCHRPKWIEVTTPLTPRVMPVVLPNVT